MLKKLSIAGVALALSFLVGCGSAPTVSSPEGAQANPAISSGEKPGQATEGGKHTHVAPHGGSVNSVSDFHVELVVDVKAGKIVAYILGEDGTSPKPIDAQSISLQAKSEGTETFSGMTLMPSPLDGEKSGNASRFEIPGGDLTKAKSFEALLRIPVDGKVFRTAFQVTPGLPATEVRSYACPMNCEKGKVYPEAVPCPECGIKMEAHCPVCHMKLAEVKQGKMEHTDHTAKHGGTFFMASDNWHHLEGVLASPSEFRIYLYDNFTQAISANGYEGTAEVVRQDEKANDLGKPLVLPLKLQPDGKYLLAEIPSEYTTPLLFTVRIVLTKKERPALFNFSFEKVSNSK